MPAGAGVSRPTRGMAVTRKWIGKDDAREAVRPGSIARPSKVVRGTHDGHVLM